MSAWLCGNKTLSLVVDVIQSGEFIEGYDDAEFHNRTEHELINILSDLNTQSLDCRYGKYEGHILQNREYIKLDVDDGQRYKSVGCYLYQTCECSEIVESPLFKALDDWYNDNTPEFEDKWDQYHWDIDNPIT